MPVRALLLICVVLLSAACHASSPASQPPTLTVFAAASLADAFDAISTEFTAATGTQILLSYAGSQDLVTQLAEGAPVDVLATASLKTMDSAVASGRIAAADIRHFAANRLALVVNPAAAGDLSELADLAAAGRSVVLADASVPAGAYAVQLLDRAAARYGTDFPARVFANVVSYETNVRTVLSRVELGEADVGIVYQSDAAAASADVIIVALPADLNPAVPYPLARVSDSAEPALADAFIAYIMSDAGQALLQRYGFLVAAP